MKNKKGLVLSILMCAFIFGVTIPLFMTNHKKVKADTITDLTGTTWVFNETISLASVDVSPVVETLRHYKYINFTSNNMSFTELQVSSSNGNTWNVLSYYSDTNYYAYMMGMWLEEGYKTITISGGSDVTNSNLITFLSNNATMTAYTPPGTEITHQYWTPFDTVFMSNNDRIGDEDIEYYIHFNEFDNNYNDTEQIGLYFLGVQTNQSPSWSYIESINGSGINILYHGTTNNIQNVMLLEFNVGDSMETDLYNLMDLNGYWFDDIPLYIYGERQGYIEGYSSGLTQGQADGTQYTGLITGIFNGLGGLLSIQVFPNITIGLLIGLPLLLGVLIIIIKILRG